MKSFQTKYGKELSLSVLSDEIFTDILIKFKIHIIYYDLFFVAKYRGLLDAVASQSSGLKVSHMVSNAQWGSALVVCSQIV